MFTSVFLRGVIRKAQRNGSWYKALDQYDHALIILAGRLKKAVRSLGICVPIVCVLAKLKRAARGKFVRLMESYGLGKARKLSGLACSWGHLEAKSWLYYFGFVRYSTVVEMNCPGGLV